MDGIASKPANENSFAVQEFSELRTLRDKVFSAFCPGRKRFPFDFLRSVVILKSIVIFNAIHFMLVESGSNPVATRFFFKRKLILKVNLLSPVKSLLCVYASDDSLSEKDTH